MPVSSYLRIHFFASFFLLCIFQGSAQQLKFEHLDISEGLPATEVYNLFQDRKGYVWAFTEYGIVKHNGSKFIPVCRNIPFTESAVYAVCESAAGNMYFANSKAAVYKVENDSAFLIKGMEEVSEEILNRSEIMFDLWVDDSSTVYFSTLQKSYRFIPGRKKVEDLSADVAHDSISLFFRQINNYYFLVKLRNASNKKSLMRVLGKNNEVLNSAVYSSAFVERTMLRKQGKEFYFLTKNELIKLGKNNTEKRLKLTENTLTLEIAPDGHVWVGVSANGVYELDSDLQILNHYLAGCTVSDILFDKRSGAWFSTIGKGVYYCKNIYDLYYDNISGLNEGLSLLKKIGDSLFIGTVDGNLFVQSAKGITKTDLGNNSFTITDLSYNNSCYTLGTKGAVLMLDKNLHPRKEKYIYKTQVLGCNGIATVKDTIKIVTGSAIFQKHVSDDSFNLLQILPRGKNIIARNDTELFIGTKSGLYSFRHRAVIPGFLKELEDKSISRLKKGPGKNIWICTKGFGLYMLSPGNKLISCKSLPSNVINDVSFVGDSLLMLSTNRGLFLTKLRTLNDNPAWRLLLDDEILSAEIYKNYIYIATKQGLVSLSSRHLQEPENPRFYLESVSIKDKKHSTCPPDLLHDENDLYFNFDLLSYPVSNIPLYYQLSGPVSENDTVNTTHLHFQNLAPGDYLLTVRPYTDVAGNTQSTIKIPFSIHPAFWQTRIFLIVLILFCIAFLILCTMLIYKRVRRKAERRSALLQMLVEYRLTALKAQINPHFISNSLAAIQQLILKNEIDKANQYIARFSLLIRYVLKYSDKFVTDLDTEIKIIELNVESEQLRFSDSFTFEKEIEPEIKTNEIFIPPLITQPFIENAIWHGLLPLKGKRKPKLLLKIGIRHSDLVISIIDNGVGRKQSTAENNVVPEARESKGTWLVINKMESLNTLYSTNGIFIRYSDLADEEGNPEGTQVDLVFPLHVLNELYNEYDK